MIKKYFLAANSCEGFVSSFNNNYNKLDGDKAYLIKGGPGTGKSTFMKKLAEKALNSGLEAELCFCSSDPDSLDGVIFEDINTIILDATPPHAIEPELPGVCENTINLGELWDEKSLYLKREKIIEATLKNKLLHRTAASYLFAAGKIFADNLELSMPCTDTDKVNSFTDFLCRRYIKPTHREKGREKIRFISGITPKGIVNFTDWIDNVYSEKIIISDRFYTVAPRIIEILRKYALSAGYDIITLKSPFLPSRITDHILIPELNLAFLSENDFISFGSNTRRIHARRFINMEKINREKQKRRFNKKIFSELLREACSILAMAKKSHDTLEKYYIESMDFEKMSLYYKIKEKQILPL